MTKEIAKELLEILACPLCKGDLYYDKSANELICYQSKLAFKIKDGIPVLLIDEAREI
ncbi:MAG TPA: Trm112 family protein [Rickettsiales bacterium]|nr:Trm112 family protein [Rickettsiales bacterium]